MFFELIGRNYAVSFCVQRLRYTNVTYLIVVLIKYGVAAVTCTADFAKTVKTLENNRACVRI